MTEPVAAPKPSTVRRVHTSLQRQMARPGGRLIIEAESRANEPESFAQAVGVAHDASVKVGADVIMLGGAG